MRESTTCEGGRGAARRLTGTRSGAQTHRTRSPCARPWQAAWAAAGWAGRARARVVLVRAATASTREERRAPRRAKQTSLAVRLNLAQPFRVIPRCQSWSDWAPPPLPTLLAWRKTDRVGCGDGHQGSRKLSKKGCGQRRPAAGGGRRSRACRGVAAHLGLERRVAVVEVVSTAHQQHDLWPSAPSSEIIFCQRVGYSHH